MKKETTKEVTQTFIKVVKTEYFCDKCGNEIKTGSYSIDTYKVIFRTGSSYPEGGSSESDQAYFCENCSYDIKELLEKNGVNFEHVEESW